MEPKDKSPSYSQSSFRKAYQFWENAKAEFGKIQWTEGEEAKVYAKVVVAATFFLGIGIYIADVFIGRTLLGLDRIFRLIFG